MTSFSDLPVELLRDITTTIEATSPADLRSWQQVSRATRDATYEASVSLRCSADHDVLLAGHARGLYTTMAKIVRKYTRTSRLVWQSADLNDDDAVRLAYSLSSLTRLEHADLSDNLIGPHSARHLLDAVRSERLTWLDFSSNLLGWTGQGAISVLCPSLQRLTSLRCLFLDDNHIDDALSISILSQSLSSLRSLNMLSLSENGFQATGATALLAALSGLPSLVSLSLEDCKITGPGVNDFCSTLRTLTSLTYMNLSFNDFSVHASAALVPSLRHLTSLRSLHVHSCGLTAADVSLTVLTQLTYLNLGDA